MNRRKKVRSSMAYWRCMRRYGAMCLLFVLLYVGVDRLQNWALQPTSFPVRSVRLYGDLHYVDKAQVQKVLSSVPSMGMLTTNLSEIRRQVEALPWVRACSVRREWPATLSFTLKEDQPIARWGDAAVLARSGRLYSVSTLSDSQALPWFRVPPDAEPGVVLADYQKIEKALSPIHREVNVFTLSSSGGMQMELDNGWQVVLGREHQQERVNRLVAIYPSLVSDSQRSLVSIDMQYANGVAVRWR